MQQGTMSRVFGCWSGWVLVAGLAVTQSAAAQSPATPAPATPTPATPAPAEEDPPPLTPGDVSPPSSPKDPEPAPPPGDQPPSAGAPEHAPPAPSSSATAPGGELSPPVATFQPIPEKPAPAHGPSSAPPSTAAWPPPDASSPVSPTPTYVPPPSQGASEVSPPASTRDESSDQSPEDHDGPLGPFRIGPIVGSGIPSVLSIGGQLKIARLIGLGVNLGFIPKITLPFYGEAKIWYQEYDLYGRIYPFRGAFFLGAALGYARVSASLTQSTGTAQLLGGVVPSGVPASVSLSADGVVRTMVLTPQIGFFHTFKSGFSIGVDVGAQFPAASSDVTLNTTLPAEIPKAYLSTVSKYVKTEEDKVRSTLETVGRTPLPVANFRIGWLL